MNYVDLGESILFEFNCPICKLQYNLSARGLKCPINCWRLAWQIWNVNRLQLARLWSFADRILIFINLPHSRNIPVLYSIKYTLRRRSFSLIKMKAYIMSQRSPSNIMFVDSILLSKQFLSHQLAYNSYAFGFPLSVTVQTFHMQRIDEFYYFISKLFLQLKPAILICQKCDICVMTTLPKSTGILWKCMIHSYL